MLIKLNLLIVLNMLLLLIAASCAALHSSYVWSLISLIITFTAGALQLFIGSMDAISFNYIVVCGSGMGVLFLWIVMTLTLKKENENKDVIYGSLKKKKIYFLVLGVSPIPFLKILFKGSGVFDISYLHYPGSLENYTYREIYGTNLIEFGSYLYFSATDVIYLGGILLFFGLVAAVFLTTKSHSRSLFYWQNSIGLLGGGMVDTLDLGSSAFAWGFKSLPSKLIDELSGMFQEILIFTLFSLITLVGVLITVAFYTLGERKIMGGIQRRQGPNVVGSHGVLQPLVDGLKLIFKETIIPLKANRYLFIVSPVISFVLAFSLWAFIPFSKVTAVVNSSIGILSVFGVSSLAVYGVILGGWASNSKYAFLGAMRTTAQMISYEIVLGTIYLNLALLAGSLNFLDIALAQQFIWFIIPLWPVVFIFTIAMLAETNRAPFDLPESEAEIVAGYNVEYSGLTFAFYFLAEYSNMLLFSALFVLFFLGGIQKSSKSLDIPAFVVKMLIIAIFFVIIRATLPRLRYDQLMFKSWTILLPIVFLFFLLLVLFFIFFLNDRNN